MSKWQMTTNDPAKLSRTRASWMRACARMALITLALGVVAALGGCGGEKKIVRYRVTINLDVDGETKSGSGVIQTLFYGGGGKNQPNQYYMSTTGVAPVVDLGRHGWLVAAIRDDNHEVTRRKRAYRLTCKDPRSIVGLLNTVPHTEIDELLKVRAGKWEVKDGNLPAFVWFPGGQPYTDAQQICPEEFARVIGANVDLKSVTVEIVPDAPFKAALDIDAPWLAEMRADQPRGNRGPQALASKQDYIPTITFFENPGLIRP
jgi:hypothetical protein